MPFSLGDLKRSYGRSGMQGGAPDVRPYLLLGTELRRQEPALKAVIEWHLAQAGRRRAEIDFDALVQLVGDYRLARCLASCVETAFAFEAPALKAAVLASGTPAHGKQIWHRLAEYGVDSPSTLRLHVFDAVNRLGNGFAPPDAREEALASIAAETGCSSRDLDGWLWLDAPEHQRLRQRGSVPTVDALASQYNRRALETLLARTIDASLLMGRTDGQAIKRLYFTVKRSGLLCELEMENPLAGSEAGARARLYGPLEVFGPRTRHGDRFARAVLDLLRAFPDIQGTARVLINEREYVLRLPAGLAAAIARHPDDGAPGEQGDDRASDEGAERVVPSVLTESVLFDSDVERQLYRTLIGMERRGDARGWQVEREPEPLVNGGTVLVPDFRFTRRGRRAAATSTGEPIQPVYLEVIGFWTPAYRERKKAKLLSLAEHTRLVLAIQEQLAPDFADLPFPVLTYKHRVSGSDLVRLLEREYGPAEIGVEALTSQLALHLCALEPTPPFVTETDLRQMLDAGPAENVRAAVEMWLTGASSWEWVPGFGLASTPWLEKVEVICTAQWQSNASTGGVSLDAFKDAVQCAEPGLATYLEVLLPRLGFEIVWESLFDATVRRSRPST
ncbi:MAG TPA: DUF790 family protein [Chloroflexota bacterium]|nr:DUF790 family protein [Chloroflexota bacterium]